MLLQRFILEIFASHLVGSLGHLYLIPLIMSRNYFMLDLVKEKISLFISLCFVWVIYFNYTHKLNNFNLFKTLSDTSVISLLHFKIIYLECIFFFFVFYTVSHRWQKRAKRKLQCHRWLTLTFPFRPFQLRVTDRIKCDIKF